MKKNIFLLSTLFCTTGIFAQNKLNLNYVENLYHATDNGSLTGTSRYKALGGAMGALGGDFSATQKNPAGASVFLNSEVTVTAGTNSTHLEANGNNSDKTNRFNLSQAGGVLVFNDLASENFRNFAISFNYEESVNNENFNKTTDLKSTNLNGFVNDLTSKISNTNFSFAANYRDKLNFGLGFNAKQFESFRYNALNEYDPVDNNNFVYTQDYSPNSVIGSGFSITAGVIGRITPEFRLGLAYETPTWYKDLNENSYEYFIEKGTNNFFAGRDTKYYVNNLNSGQKITGSAAYIIGKFGFISGDVSLIDYSTAKYLPENSFSAENNFINNHLKTSTALNLGGEYRIQDFTLRGGFRYITSPFEKVNLNLADKNMYQAYGNLTGFSLGAGYSFQSFFIDAAYSFAKQDRNILLSGNYYNYNGQVDFAHAKDLKEALDILSLDTSNRGYSRSIQNVTKKWSDFTITLGLRF